MRELKVRRRGRYERNFLTVRLLSPTAEKIKTQGVKKIK